MPQEIHYDGFSASYLENDGEVCPYCESRNIYRLTQINPETRVSDVECHDCGKMWHETYKLTGIIKSGGE